ncbi:EamA family transporter [Agaribacter flavus]|uniref:EamA family transporter n=1 Tax=Agaribacter flavus TaxID=1902781 RepID=A0ABV7FM52_9ALTE
MNTTVLFLALISVCLSVTGQVLFKQGMTLVTQQITVNAPVFTWFSALLNNASIITGLLAYVASTGVWLAVLSKTELSKAYPFIGLGIAGTMLLSYWLFDEPITSYKLVGTAFVIIGIILLAK